MMLWTLLLVDTAAAQQDKLFDYGDLLTIALVLLMLVFMPRLMYRNREKRKQIDNQAMSDIHNRVQVKTEADRVLVEIVDAGREINARLDNKIRLLNKLIKDADELLRKAGEMGGGCSVQPSSQTTQQSSLDSVSNEAQTRPVSGEQTETAVIEREPVGADSAGVNNTPEPEPQEQVHGSGRWKADMRKRIAGLSGEGRDVAEIARITRMSIAEVSLMLELIRRDS